MSAQLAKLAATDARVLSAYVDSDGAWIELHSDAAVGAGNGWHLDGCHTLHEPTVRAVLVAFRQITRCVDPTAPACDCYAHGTPRA